MDPQKSAAAGLLRQLKEDHTTTHFVHEASFGDLAALTAEAAGKLGFEGINPSTSVILLLQRHEPLAKDKGKAIASQIADDDDEEEEEEEEEELEGMKIFFNFIFFEVVTVMFFSSTSQ